MKRLNIAFFSVLALIADASAAPREVTSLDFDWHFHRGDITGVLCDDDSPASVSSGTSPFSPAYDDSSWQNVNVPHDYVFQGPLEPKANVDHGSFSLEPAWYRKTIAIP